MSSDECAELRQQEWQALQSIYPEFVPSEQPKDGEPFVLQVSVQLSEPRPVLIVNEDNPEATQSVTVSHLPPLLINLLLPPAYPLDHPPTIHSIQPSHAWLPPPLIEHLTRILLDMWDNQCVLDLWVERIQDGDQFFSALDLFHLDPKYIRIPNPSPHVLSPLLAAHNSSVLDASFRRATHTCPICITRLQGTHCMALSPCAHVACRSCLGKFWGSCIAEGDVDRVGCPDPECVKEARHASVEDVKAVVSPQEAERWQWLLRKQEAEQDPNIIYCPVTSCQKPVTRPTPAEDGQPSEWDRLRTCECGFAFCMYCRRAWHGPHTSCALLTAEDFVNSYLQHPEGSSERKAIERRHGRANILKVVARFQEEQSNRKWMDSETMACPGCRIRVQKNMGCNHMTCTKCRQHFCYRCGAKLEPAHPYRHFNTPGHPCHLKLFDSQTQDEYQWEPMGEEFEP